MLWTRQILPPTVRSALCLAAALALAASPAVAGGKKAAKPKVSLKRVTLVVSTISGERPAHVQLDAVVQYGEATVAFAQNVGPGNAIAAGQSATFDLPVDYDLPLETARLGPDLCFIAKAFTSTERWQLKAHVELLYSNGKALSFDADDLTLDGEHQSTCKSFWSPP